MSLRSKRNTGSLALGTPRDRTKVRAYVRAPSSPAEPNETASDRSIEPAHRRSALLAGCGDGYLIGAEPDAAVRGGGAAGARAPAGADPPDRPPRRPRPRRRAALPGPFQRRRHRTRRPRSLDPRIPRPPPPRTQVMDGSSTRCVPSCT
jgi:hypothetical protein